MQISGRGLNDKNIKAKNMDNKDEHFLAVYFL